MSFSSICLRRFSLSILVFAILPAASTIAQQPKATPTSIPNNSAPAHLSEVKNFEQYVTYWSAEPGCTQNYSSATTSRRAG